jgi:hypothetical protein
LVICNIFNININMNKNIIYLILMVLFSIGIRKLEYYPVLQTMSAMGWCIAGFLLLYNVIDYLMKKFTK